MHTNNNGSSYWRLKIMKIVKSYAWYCVRHVKTSEAYQLNKKRKFFCVLYQSIYFYINMKRNTNHLGNEYKLMEKKRLTNIYNSIFSMVVLIPILQLFTIYCNRKQIHYLFFFLVSAFKCQIIPPGENVLKVATVIFPFW